MNNNYPTNADPRPKRRRSKDNPYDLFSVGINTDSPRFFVCFKDGQGQFHCEEVSRELYEQLDRFELDDISEMNENDRHAEYRTAREEMKELLLHKSNIDRMLEKEKVTHDEQKKKHEHRE